MTNQQFRNDALAQRLCHLNALSFEGNRYFVFDFYDQSPLYVDSDPAKVLALVRLARRYAKNEDVGEHQRFLRLEARRSSVGEAAVAWSDESLTASDTIRLDTWLKQHNHAYVPPNPKLYVAGMVGYVLLRLVVIAFVLGAMGLMVMAVSPWSYYVDLYGGVGNARVTAIFGLLVCAGLAVWASSVAQKISPAALAKYKL